ncbi:phytanoyl hydroxylase [Fusarium coicis]|nr:phytanoyl hydroxylase [Fusarium coicis]
MKLCPPHTATHTAQHAFREGFLVNDGLLESGMIGKLKQSYPSEPIEDLRARYEKDGYLFIKAPVDGIFDPDNN